MAASIGFLLLLFAGSASAMVLPPRPTPIYASAGQPCSGLYVENRTAAILMYCEKQTIPNKRFEYMNAFDTLTQLFEGNLPQFYPNPYPGLPTFVGSEHPNPDDPLLSTEFQLFVNTAAFMAHLGGPGTANVSGDVLRNDTAFVCAFFGPASDADLGTFQYVQSVIDGIHGTKSYFLPQWPMNNISATNLPDKAHGFVINDVVDFNSQNPPLNNLSICPGPTLSLTPAQQAGQITIIANITTTNLGLRAHADAADALTNLYRTSYRCVITFITVEQPRTAWPGPGNALFWSAMMFNSFDCLHEAFLTPTVPATNTAVSNYMNVVKSMDMIVTGLSDSQFKDLENSLVAFRPGLQVHGRLNAFLTNGYRGYMANRVVNVNCNSLQACNASSSLPPASPTPTPASPTPTPSPSRSPTSAPSPTQGPSPAQGPSPTPDMNYTQIIREMYDNILIYNNIPAMLARLDPSFVATGNFRAPEFGFTGHYTKDQMPVFLALLVTYFNLTQFALTDFIEQAPITISYQHWVGTGIQTGKLLDTKVVQKWTFDSTTRLALRLEEFTEAPLMAAILYPDSYCLPQEKIVTVCHYIYNSTNNLRTIPLPF